MEVVTGDRVCILLEIKGRDTLEAASEQHLPVSSSRERIPTRGSMCSTRLMNSNSTDSLSR